MQHLELDPKVVRMAGDWSPSGKSMPDVYLQEAQWIVLKGQRRVSERRRGRQRASPRWHPTEVSLSPRSSHGDESCGGARCCGTVQISVRWQGSGLAVL